MIDINKYSPFTEKIIAAAMEVHTILGCGYLESVYQKALEYELTLRGIYFKPKLSLEVNYKDIQVGYFQPDLLIFDNIIVELKAQENINYEQIQMQVINYLVASKLEIGLLLNFGKVSLEMKRYLIPEKHQK